MSDKEIKEVIKEQLIRWGSNSLAMPLNHHVNLKYTAWQHLAPFYLSDDEINDINKDINANFLDHCDEI